MDFSKGADPLQENLEPSNSAIQLLFTKIPDISIWTFYNILDNHRIEFI